MAGDGLIPSSKSFVVKIDKPDMNKVEKFNEYPWNIRPECPNQFLIRLGQHNRRGGIIMTSVNSKNIFES